MTGNTHNGRRVASRRGAVCLLIIAPLMSGCDAKIDFTVSTQSGFAPLTVLFNGEDSRKHFAEATWSWDFGDGTTATGKSVQHTYGQPGAYTVTLTATKSNGSSESVTKDEFITVQAPDLPQAGFEAMPHEGPAPLTVTFADTSTEGTYPITNWAWDFEGDGIVDSTERNPDWTYLEVGNNTPHLTVTTSNNETAEAVDYITVQTPTPPSASFNVDHEFGDAPLEVQFTDASDPGSFPIANWAWDFNDDGTVDSTEQNPTWTYEQDGEYTARLTVSNMLGTDEATEAVSVGLNTWKKFYGPYEPNDTIIDTAPRSAKVTQDGGVLLLVTSRSREAESHQVVVAKLDRRGNVVKRTEIATGARGDWRIVDNGNGLYRLIGSATPAGTAAPRPTLVTVDGNANLLDKIVFEAEGPSGLITAAPGSTGNYLITEYFYDQHPEFYGYRLWLVNAAGQVLWTRTHAGNTEAHLYPLAARQHDDGSVLLLEHDVHRVGNVNKNWSLFAVLIDPDGNEIERVDTGYEGGFARQAFQAQDGGYYVTGGASIPDDHHVTPYFAKITADAEVAWRADWSVSESDEIDYVYVKGFTYLDGAVAFIRDESLSHQPPRYTIFCIESNGEERWSYEWSHGYPDTLMLSNDGNIWAVNSQTNLYFYDELWLTWINMLKFDRQTGNLLPTYTQPLNTDAWYASPRTAVRTGDGGLLMLGNRHSWTQGLAEIDREAWAWRVDENGRTLHQASYGKYGHENLVTEIGALTTPDGGVLAVATSEEFINASSSDTHGIRPLLLKMDRHGHIDEGPVPIAPIVSQDDTEVTVPVVADMNERQAEQILAANGLNTETVRTFNDEVPRGQVIAQNPPAGESLPPLSPVTLEISAGQPVEVPSLLTYPFIGIARLLIEDINTLERSLLPILAGTTYHQTIDEGDIITQNPAPGALVEYGSEIEVTVSLGPRTLNPNATILVILIVKHAANLLYTTDHQDLTKRRGRSVLTATRRTEPPPPTHPPPLWTAQSRASPPLWTAHSEDVNGTGRPASRGHKLRLCTPHGGSVCNGLVFRTHAVADFTNATWLALTRLRALGSAEPLPNSRIIAVPRCSPSAGKRRLPT